MSLVFHFFTFPLSQLQKSDAVDYIEEDGVVEASSIASWGLDRIDQINLPLDDVYQPIGDGNGVDVYVIDTGININHEDYAGRSTLGFDAFGSTVSFFLIGSISKVARRISIDSLCFAGVAPATIITPTFLISTEFLTSTLDQHYT